MNESIQIAICICGIIISGSTMAITVPILTMHYESLFYILFNNAIQLVIVFGIAYYFLNGKKFELPEYKKYVFQSGLYNAFMGITMVYAANPERTPPVLQALLNGLAIIPSVILTKYFLKKDVMYNYWFIIPSTLLLLASLTIPIAYMSHDFTWKSILWILLYTVGIIFRGSFNVMQEKYLTETQDGSLRNKMTLLFYTRLIQLFIIIPSFSLEYIIGYDQEPLQEFMSSIGQFFTDGIAFLLLELFVISYIMIYGFSIYLNNISTNYNMITTAAINPSVAIFFVIFSKLNTGIHFPLAIIISSLICSVLSVIFWIIGEKKSEYGRL